PPRRRPAHFRQERVTRMKPSRFDQSLQISGPGLPAVVDNPVEPREVEAFRAVQSTPLILALALSLLAAVTVGYALVASIRRRRREFGTLQALGFTSRQVN